MKVTVLAAQSQSLKTILGDVNFKLANEQRDEAEYTLTLQNLGGQDIYLENNAAAAVATGYKLTAGNDVEINYTHIEQLQLISDGVDNTDVRIIIT